MAPAQDDRDLIVQQDRDRIAAGLQDQVIQRIFAAGLTLQGAAALATEPAVRRRIQEAIADLDQAVTIVRDTVFGLEHRLADRGLRQEFLKLLGGLVPTPEISFSGPVDGALPPGTGIVLVGMVRDALDLIGPRLVPARVAVSASDSTHVTVVEAVYSAAGQAAGPGHDFPSLRQRAASAGMRLDIEPGAEVTRLAWHIRLGAPGTITSP